VNDQGAGLRFRAFSFATRFLSSIDPLNVNETELCASNHHPGSRAARFIKLCVPKT
jgi:hypothetical protein